MPKILTDVVVSHDGTTIGYRILGNGPGLVLLHGAMSSGHNHVQLAEALADSFTVYLPDRRGRGLSGPYQDDYSVRHDVADLAAVVSATGTQDVFGVSSGGVICLEAALELPAVRRVAVYEPPLFASREMPTAVLTRFDDEMANGKLAAALVTGIKGARLGPPIFNVVPRPLLERLTKMAMAGEEKKAKTTKSDYVPMRALAPTLHYDFRLTIEASGATDRYCNLPAQVLLLGGSKSPAYLRDALTALARSLPNAQRVELPGLDHAASWNADRGGKPEPVAAELRRFFAPPLPLPPQSPCA